MSMVTAAAAPLAIKKTRTVNAVKKEAPSKAPRALKKLLPAEATKPPAAPPSTQTMANPSDKPLDEMDSLMAGMKKIRINVVTAAQKEARDKAKKEKTEQRAVPLKEIPPVPELAAPQAPPGAAELGPTPTIELPRPEEPMELPTQRRELPTQRHELPTQRQHGILAAPNGPATPAQERQHIPHPPKPQQVPLPASSPVFSSTPQYGSSPTEGGAPSVFIPYQPEGATPEPLPQTQPLQWLPPNNATTPSPMKRGDLPMFTATSAIPFAVTPRQAGAGETVSPKSKPASEPKSDDWSVWEIPETPQQ